jgi:site-specific DNA-methyltransferase (adenine-specific)/modification methylase
LPKEEKVSLPAPYYEDAHSTIYNADCRDILPHLPKVDLVLTDPPYGIGEAAGKNKTRGLAAKPTDYGDDSWDDNPIDPCLLRDVLSAGSLCCMWGGNYYEMEPSPSWLVWEKMNGQTDFADCELAWTNYGCAVRLKKHLWNGMLRKGREYRHHPTQKPLEVIEWAMSLCPGEPQTILDPFMGSGTTLVAAKQLGRKAIGIEISRDYCEIAVNRLRQGVLAL